MRRADRLFKIVQYLRGRRLTTAQQLAQWLAVSPRTIYRDVRDLSLSGTPIEGEAGIGYRLKASMDLPPLHFELEEIEALALGANMVEAWSGPSLASAAIAALAKISAALPKDRLSWLEVSRTFVPSFHIPKQHGERFEDIRAAIAQRARLEFVYSNAEGVLSARCVWPLSLYFWGEHWTLAAWCESRAAFRSFRIERMLRIKTGERFPDQAGRRLADFRHSLNKEIKNV
jgi:predicted DNA-binding transcriptional regulator YafY